MKKNEIKVLGDIEHVLTVPGRYIGSTKLNKRNEWVLEDGKIIKKKIEFVPAFLTMFKEVISNSIDEALRTDFKYANKIDVGIQDGTITIKDNGRGVPSAIEESTGLPQSIVGFTQLKAGTNFDEDFVSIGQNGEGVSLVNIFSTYFHLDTSDGKKRTRLACKNNLSESDYKLTRSNRHYTIVSYHPDYTRLSLQGLDDIHYALIHKTVIDLSLCFPKIKFTFNKKRIIHRQFKDYMKFYVDDFECFSFENVDIGIISGEHDSVSFVNGINTRRGGWHLHTVITNVSYGLRELIAKRYKAIKPQDVKNKTIFIVNLRNMVAPRFDSQTKEELINTGQDMLDLYEDVDYETICMKLRKNKEFVFPIIEMYKIKEELRKRRELGDKERKIKKAPVPKLIEANSERREKCSLYIAEGMSALGNFLQCRDANFHAGFPLRGKFKSCQDVEPSVLIKNKEVADLCSIIDVKLSSRKIQNMRYGKIVILTDSDPDGDSICCGLINFFYTFWPEMISEGKLHKAMSPLIKAKNLKTEEIRSFYTLEDWRSVNNSDWELLAYNKGLGSLDEDDYKFSLDNLIKITEDEAARATLDIAFGRDSGPRKEWMIE